MLRTQIRFFSILSGILKRLEVHDKMLKYVMSVVSRLNTIVGKSFEAFARKTVEEYLKDLGVIPKGTKLTSKGLMVDLRLIFFQRIL